MKQFSKKISLLFLLVSSFIACDKDYNDIGTNLLINSSFITDSIEFPALTYNKVVPPVRSSNITSSLLGVYKDPIYGVSTAHIVTQIVPSTFTINFVADTDEENLLEEPVVDDIILNVPYFSTNTGEDDEDGNSIYELDSLYGDAPIKLAIYQNNYFLRDYDPETNLEELQQYYSNSNQTINFDSFIGETFYNTEDDDTPDFVPDPSEIVLYEDYNEETQEWEESERLVPAMRLHLKNPNQFWDHLLFDNENSPVLSNSNNFKDYFRGLYFKTEALDDNGNMILLDFSSASILIKYHYTIETTNDDDEVVEETVDREFTFNISGNKVNVLENNYDITLSDGDNVNGDEEIYLKGMEGSMGIIKLFGNLDIPVIIDGIEYDDYLDYFKRTFKDGDTPTRLINEANLILYVDQDIVDNNGQEPDRLYLYDLKNSLFLKDYSDDLTLNTGNPLYSRIVFSRNLERDDESNEGVYYKFRITEHLNNILLKDSTNLDLGLVVTTNINSIESLDLEGANEDSDVEVLPLGAFLSPRGTVLYGSNNNVPDNKRIKLEIFYSELGEP